MKRSLFLFILVLVIWPITAQEFSSGSSVVENHNNFAFRVYDRIRTGDDNLIYSPISMYAVLAQAYAGARSTTADQLAELLQVSVPDEEFHSALIALMSKQ